MVKDIDFYMKELKKKSYLKDKLDNELLLKYLESKRIGSYGGLDYGDSGNGCSDRTLLRDITGINKCLNHLKKPFHKLNRDDIIKLRNDLRLNKVQARKRAYKKHNSKDSKNQQKIYYKTMTYRTKKSYFTSLAQFWKFYQEYQYVINKGKEIPNIFERVILKKPKETEHKIDYLTKDEMKEFFEEISRDKELKFFYCIAIATGARPIELANIRKKHFILKKVDDSKKKDLFVKLPSIKGCSGRKNEVEVCYETFYIINQLKNFEDDDLLFNLIDENKPLIDSPNCYDWDDKKYGSIKNKVKYITNKLFKKKLTIKHFRKTSTMYFLNETENITWVQKLLGHVEGSKAIKNYMSLQSIKTPETLKKNIKKDKYLDVKDEMDYIKDENTKLKFNMKKQERQLESMSSMMGLLTDKLFGNEITKKEYMSKEDDIKKYIELKKSMR